MRYLAVGLLLCLCFFAGGALAQQHRRCADSLVRRDAFEQRLRKLLSDSIPSQDYERGLTPIKYLLGLHPFSASPLCPYAGLQMDGELSSAATRELEIGAVVVLVRRNKVHRFALSLGEKKFLAFPVRHDEGPPKIGGIETFIKRGFTLVKLIPYRDFKRLLPYHRIESYSQWRLAVDRPLTWKQYDAIFTYQLHSNMTLKGMHQTIGRRRWDEQEKGMRQQSDKALGLQVNKEGQLSPSLTLESIVQGQQEWNRHLKPRQKFTSARVFLDQRNQVRFKPFGKEAPKRWKEIGRDSIPPQYFAKMLRSQHNPLSLDRASHDLEHVTALADHPEFAGALLNYLKARNSNAAELAIRLPFLWESVAVVPEDKRRKLKKGLHPVFDRKRTLFTVAELKPLLSQLPPHRLTAHTKALLQNYFPLVDTCGGAARGACTSPFTSANVARVTPNGMAIRIELLLLEYEGTPHPSMKDPFRKQLLQANQDNLLNTLIHELARFEVFLWNSTFLTPVELVEGLAKKRVPKKSKIYDFFVRSGVFDNVDGPNTHFNLRDSIEALAH